MAETAEKQARFEIFRKEGGRDYKEHAILKFEGVTPAIEDGLRAFSPEGSVPGQEVTMVYAAPGFSLTHVWFKSGYPLPLHSHGSDCLYYIIAGGLTVGTEAPLGPGDGFFVGSHVPYTYTPGPEGVEVLEFRGTDALDIRFLSKTAKAWDKIATQARARQEAWANERPPTEIANG